MHATTTHDELLSAHAQALSLRFAAIDKEVLAIARAQLVLLLEDLPAAQPLYDDYKNFIQFYKSTTWPHLEHPTNF